VDRLAQAYASSPLLFWIAASLLVHTLATNLCWPFRSAAFCRSRYGRAVAQVGRFVFFLGIPYLVLGGWPRRPFQGILSLEDLGLVGLDARWPLTRWLDAAGTTVGLGVVILLFLSVAWINARQAAGVHRISFSSEPWWAVVAGVLYLEIHWAFYRSALVTSLNSLHSGVFLGLGLVYLEWGLDPFWRQGWQPDSQPAARWLQATLALIVALLFLLTRNLWLCISFHLLVELIFRRLARSQAIAPSIDQTL
jgi:hypothetical protein